MLLAECDILWSILFFSSAQPFCASETSAPDKQCPLLKLIAHEPHHDESCYENIPYFRLKLSEKRQIKVKNRKGRTLTLPKTYTMCALFKRLGQSTVRRVPFFFQIILRNVHSINLCNYFKNTRRKNIPTAYNIFITRKYPRKSLTGISKHFGKNNLPCVAVLDGMANPTSTLILIVY